LISGDLAALSALLDNDLNYVHSNGEADSKDKYIESPRQGRITYEEISVTVTGRPRVVLCWSNSYPPECASGQEPSLSRDR
jgi:hypothetical protein